MKRILLKLSGEALAGNNYEKKGFDEEKVLEVAKQIREVAASGIEIGIVIGGGNFWRGRSSSGTMNREQADEIGMLATVMNCLYVSEICRYLGLQTAVYTPFACSTFTKIYAIDEVEADLAAGKIVFFAGGIGHPYFSTDTGTVLRAIQIKADAILVAKAIDGIYDSDPKLNPQAKKYDVISIDQVIEDKLAAMDMTASIMCRDNGVSMLVFALAEENSILHAVKGDSFNGTKVMAK